MGLDDFKHINDGLGHQYGDILFAAHAIKQPCQEIIVRLIFDFFLINLSVMCEELCRASCLKELQRIRWQVPIHL